MATKVGQMKNLAHGDFGDDHKNRADENPAPDNLPTLRLIANTRQFAFGKKRHEVEYNSGNRIVLRNLRLAIETRNWI